MLPYAVPSFFLLTLVICPRLQWDDKIHNVVEPFWIIVEDSDSGGLLLAWLGGWDSGGTFWGAAVLLLWPRQAGTGQARRRCSLAL